jgi:hypothetical protein
MSMLRKRSAPVILALLLTSAFSVAANAAHEGSGTVSHNHDPFFGAWTSVAGNIPLSESLQFTVYGILWDSFRWTEYGAGVSFDTSSVSGSALVGLTNGNILSGGTGLQFGEGVVPNVTLNSKSDVIDAQIYAGYYKALQAQAGASSNDYLHYWTYAGYKLSSRVAIGAHWEHLQNTRGPAGNNMVYGWLGPYVNFNIKSNFGFRIAGGMDLDEDRGQSDFFKAGVTLNF